MMTSHITIENGRGVITLAPDGPVWMTKHGIANLFGYFVAKVVSNIASILKGGVLNESRVCRFHRYRNSRGVELYSLEMITALAFRIDTPNADIFRRWLMERATRPEQKFSLPAAHLGVRADERLRYGEHRRQRGIGEHPR